jgi:predicted DNA-binding protein
MKGKRFIMGVSLFLTPEMYEQIRLMSNDQKTSLSEIIRNLLEEGLAGRNNREKENLE